MKKYLRYILLPAIIFIASWNHHEGHITDQPSSGTIKAGKLDVYYERTGKGDAIVFLHAGLQDHTMWDEQVKELSKQYEVLTVDLPFHGKTMGTDTTLLIADMIRIVLDSLHVQKVSIAGLSMGGYCVMDFLIAYPDRVNKAIMIAAGVNGYENIHPADSISMDWYRLFSKALEEKDTVRAAREFTKAWAEGIYRRSDSLKTPVSQYVYKKTLETLRRHKMEGWPRLQQDPQAIKNIFSIKRPVLIIDGDKDLPFVTANAEFMEKNIAGAKRVVIKDVAHMVNLEKPAELNKLILDFLKEK
jgi:pimeloyl-ACP methyl ester carboxylesterase